MSHQLCCRYGRARKVWFSIRTVSQAMPQPARLPLVYVADDDQAVLGSLRFLLEAEGFRVRVFASGAALLADPALAAAECIVVDYHMSNLNGIEVVRALRERKLAAPVVMITGDHGFAFRNRARDIGIVRVIEKPLLDGAFVDVVRGAIEGLHADDPVSAPP